jgi:pimeloyl-ACP methyl ester carboxylesterase
MPPAPGSKAPPGFAPKGFPPVPKALPQPQPPSKTVPKGQPPAAKGAKGKIEAPKDETLVTRDGVSVRATFYPGAAKKESVPIIMVHGAEGQRGDFKLLAEFLQQQGHSIIVPDLRGHGESTKAEGVTQKLDAEKFNRASYEAMVLDVEACKKFLMEKNNAGELNIDQLCVVGAELGAIIAVRWAALDWSVPDLPAYRQGKDVKALVLLSPLNSFKGITLREALNNQAVQSQLSIQIIAGAKDKAASEAKRIHNSLQAHHPKLDDHDEDRLKKQEIFLVQPDTNLSGTKLLAPGLSVPQNIARFIDLRLVSRKSQFPWTERKNPLAN